LRYYTALQWGPLAAAAGLRLVEVTNTQTARGAPGPHSGSEAPDLIAILERPGWNPAVSR
ncbi:MAG TPA: hypothetical protein VLT61_01230, partial [Anaeromyxobacteraceae bacterium]|nr:hypothetical protein [Anaeromyxobacteraceae bacterium]